MGSDFLAPGGFGARRLIGDLERDSWFLLVRVRDWTEVGGEGGHTMP